MNAIVDIQLDGIEQALERVGALAERAAHMAPAFTIVAELLELHVGQTFATQGARIGKPWTELARRTQIARGLTGRRSGYYAQWSPTRGVTPTGPVLVWHGRLRGSFARGGVGHIRQVSDSGLIWGSGIRYARFHRFTRPMLGFRDEFQRREVLFQPLRLWLQGVPEGAIRATMRTRLR